MNFEHEVIEAVIDTNYRRLVDGRSINIFLGGIHNIVVGSDIDKTFISKMIMIRQYSRDEWELYWKEKLGIKGYFNIRIEEVQIS